MEVAAGLNKPGIYSWNLHILPANAGILAFAIVRPRWLVGKGGWGPMLQSSSALVYATRDCNRSS